MFSLRDRVALITGAGNGIGRAIATACARAGADVIVAGRKAATLLTESWNLLGGYTG